MKTRKIEIFTDLGSSGGPGETNIKTSSECSWSRVLVLHTEHAAVNIGVALVHRVQVELLKHSPGQEEPSAVGCSIVGQTNLDPVPGEQIILG